MPTTYTRDEWKELGSCNNEDPNLWYSDDKEEQEQARQICYHCPVLETCFEKALQKREPYGIWGGLDEDDRRHLIRRITRSGRSRPVRDLLSARKR